MPADECGKQCCVIDTSALINLCKLELGTKRAIEWVMEDFCVLIPKKIFDEGRSYVSRTDYDERRLYYSAVLAVVRNVNEICEIIIDEQVTHLEPPKRSRIDAGEKAAASFAYEMSRLHRQYVLFITNDFKASDPLKEVFSRIQVGFLRDAYDILAFIASRHPEELPRRALEIALRDLNAMVRDSDKPPEERLLPDEVLARHLDVLTRYPDAFAPI